MAYDREALKAQLRQRTKESYERKDAFSDTSTGIFDPAAQVKQLSTSVLTEGAHFIDIIPFVAGRYWPTKLNFGGTGQWAPFMEIFVHTNVGTSNAEFCCPAANWGQPCPICEQQQVLRNKWAEPTDEQKEIIKNLYPKRRCVYNVILADDQKSLAQGVQVFNMAHWSLQRHIESLIVGRSGAPEIFYSDPEEGKTVKFTRQGKGMTTQYIGVSFVDRDYVISDEELDQAFCLDECLALPKGADGNVLWKHYYAIIKDAFFHGDEDDSSDAVTPPPPPQSTPARRAAPAAAAPVTEQPPVESDVRARRNPPMAAAPEEPATTAEYQAPTDLTRRTRASVAETTEHPQPANPVSETSEPPVRSRRRLA